MNCLPSNVKTFIDILFLAFTLTNFWCGKKVLSFTFKTFLTILDSFLFLSCGFSDNRYNHISSYLFQSHWYLSHVSLSTFNLLYFSVFCDWILLCSAALHGQYTVSGLYQVLSGEFLVFFYCVFFSLSAVWSYCSWCHCSIQSLELYFKFNK